MDKNSKILISGAGVAGMACALWLARQGFQPVIVEKSTTPRVGGFLVALSHQAYFFAEEMELLPALREFDLKINTSTYHDHRDHCLLKLEYDKLFDGLGIIQLSRDDLAKVLYAKVKDMVEIRFGESIQTIEKSDTHADVTFDSGAQEKYDVVIGADGLHSVVRNQIFKPEEYKRHYLDLHVAAYKLPNSLNIDSKFETHMERHRYMAVHNTIGKEIGAVFVWHNEGKKLPAVEDRGAYLKESYQNSCPTTEKVLEHCPMNEGFYMDVLSQIDLPIWSKGRCVLLGDAAHCLTLFSGRGAAGAFAGACRLARALTELEPQVAFEKYETETRPIIDDIMPATRNAVKWYVPRTFSNHMIRDGLMRYIPNAVFRQYFKRKYSKI